MKLSTKLGQLLRAILLSREPTNKKKDTKQKFIWIEQTSNTSPIFITDIYVTILFKQITLLLYYFCGKKVQNAHFWSISFSPKALFALTKAESPSINMSGAEDVLWRWPSGLIFGDMTQPINRNLSEDFSLFKLYLQKYTWYIPFHE